MNRPADRERRALEVLQDIVIETMDYPPQKRHSSDSYLPEYLISRAQAALALYGLQMDANPAMMASVVPAA